MKKTSLYLPEELDLEIERVARHLGRSKAEVVREAVAEYVSGKAPKRVFHSLGVWASDRAPGTSIADDEEEWLKGFGED